RRPGGGRRAGRTGHRAYFRLVRRTHRARAAAIPSRAATAPPYRYHSPLGTAATTTLPCRDGESSTNEATIQPSAGAIARATELMPQAPNPQGASRIRQKRIAAAGNEPIIQAPYWNEPIR